jgi:tetratricopeptide (TPR) repeat protein
LAYIGTWYGFGEDPEFDAAVRLYASGEFAEAAEVFRAVAAKLREPGLRNRAKSYLAGSLGHVGRAALDEGRLDDAEQALGDAAAARPRYADLHALLALVHYAKGERAKCGEEVAAALRIHARYGFAAMLEAGLMMLGPDPVSGLVRLVESATLDRRLENEVFRSAVDAADREDWQAAADAVFSMRPPRSMVDDYLRQGDEAMRAKDWPAAVAAYAEATEIAPNFADIRARMGQALLEIGQVAEAVAQFRYAVELAPDYAAGHAMLGVALRRSGDEDGAGEAFRNALALDPSDPIAGFELGRLR